MMWIEMVMHMSGTRANGEKYPPGWTPFQVEDWEGEHLIRGGMAREAPVPDWAVPKPPAQDGPKADKGRDWGGSPAPQVPASEPSPTAAGPQPDPASVMPAAAPPAPGDPKQAWVNYAVTQGMSADDAARMTKADLQSRFGPRL